MLAWIRARDRSPPSGQARGQAFRDHALALRARRLVQRSAQSASQLQGVIGRPEMHENETRLLGQHVAVNGRHFDAVGAQRSDNGVNYLSREDEVTRYCSFAA